MAQTMDNLAVARESIEAFNRGDWESFKQTHAENSVYDEIATQRHVEGRDAIMQLNQEWKSAFPDANGTIERAIESGDTVTLEITWRGHQEGPLQMPEGQLPPTGRAVEMKAADVLEIHDGKITSEHHYFDMAGMMQQLGVN